MDNYLDEREKEFENVRELFEQYCVQYNPSARIEAGKLLADQFSGLTDPQLRDFKSYSANIRREEQEKLDKEYDASPKPTGDLAATFNLRPVPKPLIPNIAFVEDTKNRILGVTVGLVECSTYVDRTANNPAEKIP